MLARKERDEGNEGDGCDCPGECGTESAIVRRSGAQVGCGAGNRSAPMAELGSRRELGAARAAVRAGE